MIFVPGVDTAAVLLSRKKLIPTAVVEILEMQICSLAK